uniref:Extended synaptotagmin-like protein 2b n=1 Tax=Denticeps clupeoides TaxID=299321 RepID=A0AAY4A302_9TELE
MSGQKATPEPKTPPPTTAKQNGPDAAPGPGTGPPGADQDAQSSVADATQMGVRFAKTFAFLFPIYVLGYFEFSFSWVLVGLALFFWWRRRCGTEAADRVSRALAFLEQQDPAVRQSLPMSDLPPWVHFPDVERVEWLNKTVKQMWPYICQFVDKLFRETIEPAVKGANPHLSTFCFTKVDMGDKPLRVNGVKVYNENVDKRQIIMDLQISFVGNTEINVDIQKYYCRAGIKSIQLLDINWTGLTNMLDIPGVSSLSDNLIQDIIGGLLVLPNKINIPLVNSAQMAKLRFPMPKGVLRIHFIEAQELLAKDKFLGGMIKGKSDPYGVLQLGNQLFQSKVIQNSLNPYWNEVYEAMVYDPSANNLSIELFDEDPDKDDFLGSLTIDMIETQKKQKVDEWFVLEGVASGKLHLKLEWLSLLSTPAQLSQVLSSIRADKGLANDGLSSALLLVHLDSAKQLPRNPLEFNHAGLKKASVNKAIQSGKKVSSDPSPFVQFTVGHKSFESKTRYKTNEPVWEEAFTFLIHNPNVQQLDVEVNDGRHECSLGKLTVPLTKLLEAEDMTLSERFPLKESGPSTTLKMKMALRVQTSACLYFLSWVFPATPSTPAKTVPTNPPQPKNTQTPTPEPTSKPRPPPTTEPMQVHTPTHMQSEPSDSPSHLTVMGRSSSNLAISGSHTHLNKEPTPSIASDISNPYAAQELQSRIRQLQNGSTPSHFPLGEVQLTIRHSAQRNKVIVVVHSCRNLIQFTDSGSDPYVRLYLLPDKRRSGRRKTGTQKKTLNPVYDQTFEFSVSIVELHRRTLDVAVKNGGGLLSKHKGLLGKVSFRLDQSRTLWFECHLPCCIPRTPYPL